MLDKQEKRCYNLEKAKKNMEKDIKPTKRITIKDIAKETGFTAQTVSLALRNKECITEKTRAIVNETAKKLGYIKNGMATNLRQGHTNTVAIVYDNIANPYFSIMTRYLQYYLREKGYFLLIFTTDSYYLDQESFYNILSCNVAGVISFLDVDENIAKLGHQNNLPVLVLGRKADKSISWITTSENKGGELAAQYLIDRGSKNNLHITYSLDMICAKERYEGFYNALKANGLKDDLLLVLGRVRLKELLVDYLKAHEVDGIFAFNDMVAYETLAILKEIHRNDIKVVGFDNIQEMFRFPTRISTVGADKKAMAKAAVEVLLRQIEKVDESLEHRIFDVFLVVEDE